jgi:hypothetical protein
MTQMRPMSDVVDEDSKDSVTYYSDNTAGNTSFKAVSPPNCEHAAELAEIALLVQANQAQKRKAKKKKLELPPAKVRQRRIQSISHQATTDQTQENVPSVQYAKPEQVYDPQAQPIYQGREQQYYDQVPRAQHLDDSPRQQALSTPYISTIYPPQQPEVTRYQTEERTSYQVKSANGKLYVSAPVDSSEARLFDEVARVSSVNSKVCGIRA